MIAISSWPIFPRMGNSFSNLCYRVGCGKSMLEIKSDYWEWINIILASIPQCQMGRQHSGKVRCNKEKDYG